MIGLRLTATLMLLLLSLLWPSPLSSPGWWQPSNGSDGGGDGNYWGNYLAVFDSPGDVVHLGGPGPVDVPPVEAVPEPERPQPSTRGGLRVWVTHYSAPIGAVVASEHPAGFRPGICATYAVRDATRRIIGAHLPGHGILPFGTVLVIGGDVRCEVWDTGRGYDDARLWVDVAVESNGLAKELGAGWRQVKVIE